MRVKMRFMRGMLALCLLAAGGAQAAPQCYSGAALFDSVKPNKLYLYFPAAADMTFPVWDPAEPIAIGGAFDPSGFGMGYAALAMRNAIYDVVASDYCEFNVHVISTTTNPDLLASPPARRNMIAVGSDADTMGAYSLYGIAEAVDYGDADPVDHARVWGGSYDAFASCAAPLSGAGDTLERWAFGIGGTTAHEAGHNYGLTHGNGAIVNSGEDGLTNHIMPAGPSVPCTERVDQRRHFNDTNFSILGNNVGLTIQTMTNWDFVNPNPSNAHGLRMEVLSTAGSLVTSWVYTGTKSPWSAPAVSTLPGTVLFQGVTYNRYQIQWTTDKAWQSPNQPAPPSISGEVRAAEIFHVGISFSGVDVFSDPVLVRSVELLNSANNPLPLNPRTPSYDTGTINLDSGDFFLTLFNLFDTPLILRELVVLPLPRQADIEALVLERFLDRKFFDVRGQVFQPWGQIQVGIPDEGRLPPEGKEVPLLISNLFRQGHNVRLISGKQDPGDADVPSPEKNLDLAGGLSTDPFPATTLLMMALVEDPGTQYFDPAQDKVVNATSRVFFQVAGKRLKPVIGRLGNLVDPKVVCVNLSKRKSKPAALDSQTREFDCESSGLPSFHGDSVQVSQKGQVEDPQAFEVEVAGMDVERVVCTNLSKRTSIAFDHEGFGPINCARAGLEMNRGDVVNVTQKGTAR